MSQPGETDNYSMEDHIRAIEKHAFKNPVDLVVVDQSYIPQSILDKYAHMNSYPIQVQEKEHSYQILKRSMIYFDEKGRIRHDPKAVREVVEEILKAL